MSCEKKPLILLGVRRYNIYIYMSRLVSEGRLILSLDNAFG
jgi:hypothetical protein